MNAEIVKTRKTDIKIFATYRPFITLLYYAAFALVFGYGTYFCICYGIVAWPLLGSYISLSVIGIIEIFYSLVGRFFNPIQTLADQLNALQKAFTSCERLYNLLDIKPDLEIVKMLLKLNILMVILSSRMYGLHTKKASGF